MIFKISAYQGPGTPESEEDLLINIYWQRCGVEVSTKLFQRGLAIYQFTYLEFMIIMYLNRLLLAVENFILSTLMQSSSVKTGLPGFS
jgi:hypothetical protein